MLTAIVGTTKTGSIKTARQRSFAAKEDIADASYESCPVDALKSVELSIKGVNDDGAFGKNTVGQEFDGKLMLYAGDAKIRTFAHELVTKTIEAVQLVTNSGLQYTFATADGTPAMSFAYETAQLGQVDDKPVMITLLMTGFRDNLVID